MRAKRLMQIRKSINGVKETFRGVDPDAYKALINAAAEITLALSLERRRLKVSQSHSKLD